MTPILNQKIPDSPFRGIHPFEFIHHSLFFGREKEIADLLSKVLISRFVLLFGESGTGKSSLINAGLIPILLKESLNPEKIRLNPLLDDPLIIGKIQTSIDNNVLFLPTIFNNNQSNISDQSSNKTSYSLERFVQTVKENATKIRTVLIFDQFEELFTLSRLNNQSSFNRGDLSQQFKILKMIFEIANDNLLPVKIIVIIREDFLGKLEVVAKDYPKIFDYRLRLRHLNSDSARNAILKPFENLNSFNSIIKKELADTILKDLSKNKPDVFIQPTQLQIICSRLWEEYGFDKTEIGIDEYKQLGEVEGILEGFLRSELVKAQKQQLKSECIKILGNLITDVYTRDVVSKRKLQKLILLKEQEKETKKMDRALELLQNQRLINVTFQRDTYYYEVASEYLIPAIKKEYQQLLQEQKIDEAIMNATEDARKKKVKFKRIAFIFLFIIIIIFATVVSMLWINANNQRKIAENERKLAEQAQKRIMESIKLRQAVLSRDINLLREALKTASIDNEIIFRAIAKEYPYKSVDGRPTYQFQMFPVEESIPAGFKSLALITYIMDHPTFATPLITTSPDMKFIGTYDGVGCLPRVIVLIEYSDLNKPISISQFNMCDILDVRPLSKNND